MACCKRKIATLLDLPDEILAYILELVNPSLIDLIRDLIHVNSRVRSVVLSSSLVRNKSISLPSRWSSVKATRFLLLPFVQAAASKLTIHCSLLADELRLINNLRQLKCLVLHNYSVYGIENAILSCPVLESIELHASPQRPKRTPTSEEPERLYTWHDEKGRPKSCCSFAEMLTPFGPGDIVALNQPLSVSDGPTRYQHSKLKELKLFYCTFSTIKTFLESVNGAGTLETLYLFDCNLSRRVIQSNIIKLHPSTWDKFLNLRIYQSNNVPAVLVRVILPIMHHLLELSVPLKSLAVPRMPCPRRLGPFPTLTALELDLSLEGSDVEHQGAIPGTRFHAVHEGWLRPMGDLVELYPKLEILRIQVPEDFKEKEFERLLLLCRSLTWLHTVSITCPENVAKFEEAAERVHNKWLRGCVHEDLLFNQNYWFTTLFYPVTHRQ